VAKTKGKLDGNQTTKNSSRKEKAKALFGHRQPRRQGQCLRELLPSHLRWVSSMKNLMIKMVRVGSQIDRWQIDQTLKLESINRKI